MMRSKLFVPGSRPELFDKAMASAADALSLDLEDAVAPAKKDEARKTIGDFLTRLGRAHEKVMIVRVNAIGTPQFAEDVDAVVTAGTDLINLPKLESAEEVERAVAAIIAVEERKGLAHRIGVLANVESPKGWQHIYEIAAAHERIAGMQFGVADLLAPNRIERHDAALSAVRFTTKMAAANAGVPAYDTVYVNIGDTLGLERDAIAARRMGYIGKSCIHPSQIAVVNAVFTPPDSEIAWAQKVLAAAADPANKGLGAFVVDGRMVDEPFFREARATVELARRLKLIS
ncbi:MAG: HpcH/HpaI aldolase/citrate lyase family protein [Bacteroidota bacterium]